jgi:hypothetical protein
VTTCPASSPSERRRVGRPALAAAALLLTLPLARAAGDDDALNLQSAPVESAPVTAGSNRAMIEFALGHADRRQPPTSQTLYRASADLSLSSQLAPGWRGVLSDRFDALDPAEPDKDHALNSLREAYVSWSDARARWAADLGRVNVRLGTAYGYNPTDFFRDGSLRAYTTADPIALRHNRMGTVMLRGQHLWQGGSVSLAYSPKLADNPSGDAFSLDLGSTNSRNRGLLVLGLQASERVSGQFALYKDDGLNPQPGASLSALVSDAVVAYAEWSAGREPSLADRAWGVSGHEVSGNRFAAGFTFTAPTKTSLTFEVQGNGFALSQSDWDAAAATDPALLGAYLREAQRRQDLPSRRGWMVYASQPDLGLKNLDLTAFWQQNPGDGSHVAWLELRHHWARVELALQLQDNVGNSTSVYGILPERRSVQLLFGYHLL